MDPFRIDSPGGRLIFHQGTFLTDTTEKEEKAGNTSAAATAGHGHHKDAASSPNLNQNKHGEKKKGKSKKQKNALIDRIINNHHMNRKVGMPRRRKSERYICTL